MEFAVLLFIRSIREGDFGGYVKCLTFVCGIFTANNNYNYAKWVPIHLRDMLLLSKRCPDVFREFSAGKFVIQKTGNNFSGLAFDHGHEQVNAVIKGDGGAVGLTEDEDALRRWMLAMPEVIEILADYTSESDNATSHKHHEQTMNRQQDFKKKVTSLPH